MLAKIVIKEDSFCGDAVCEVHVQKPSLIKLKNLSNDKRDELLKILGDKAEEFFDVSREYRLNVPRKYTMNLGPGSLGIYSTSNKDVFKKILKKDLTKEQLKNLNNMHKEFKKAQCYLNMSS